MTGWMTFQVDSPGTVLISTLLDILALDILGLDILGRFRADVGKRREICPNPLKFHINSLSLS